MTSLLLSHSVGSFSIVFSSLTCLYAYLSNFPRAGELTTPQLHYIVRCVNTAGAYGDASAVGYYTKLSTAFTQLYSGSVCIGSSTLSNQCSLRRHL